ncbi:MAG: TerD family protein [Candidatus Sericytochromatia bacterium]|nr:TerD family protein [Candidatus Sericytochromatia bacterium]
MQDLVAGQKLKLSELTQDTRLSVAVELAVGSGAACQVFCFGLRADQQSAGPDYVIFGGNQESPCRALQLETPDHRMAGGFRLHLDKLPADIVRIAIAVARNPTAAVLVTGTLHLRNSEQVDLASFAFGAAGDGQAAVIVTEVYLKDVWRLAAVGQGFKEGTPALWRHFGITRPIGDFLGLSEAPAAVVKPATPVRLGKVILQKQGDQQKVSLKKDTGNNPICLNLNWAKPQTDGPLKLVQSLWSDKPDLDLGCFYLLRDGQKGVIQPLGGMFGAKHHSPYIYLDKDDRTGTDSDGENLFLFRPAEVLLVVVFAFIYEGAANFRDVGAVMRIRDQAENEIAINLDNPTPGRTFCAICSIQGTDDGIVLTKEERYFLGHRDADEHYGFGFTWVAGSK